MPEKETWENATLSQVWILTNDPRGETRSELVRPGQKIQVSVDERLLNSDRAYAPDVDAFKNGSLIPVRLIDSAEDYAEHANNPNNLSESDMVDLFKLSAAAFKKRLAEIQNPAAMDRIVTLSEDESNKATLAQVKAAQARLEELRPSKIGKQLFKETAVTPG
jgi:hypothetical protein